jgi:hypothetical protein
MANQSHDEHLRFWQHQPVEGRSASSDDVRRKVDELATKLRRRDFVMYVSGAVIVPSWVAVMWFLPGLRATAGVGLATAAWVIYQLRKRSAARAITSDLAGRPCLDFHRTLLERERDLYRKMSVWYLLPVGLSQIAILVSLLTNERFLHTPPFILFVLAFIGSGIVVLVVARNRWHREATALQGEIESLKALDGRT